MRSRKEIIATSSDDGFYSDYRQRDAILEVLLDIRELLATRSTTDATSEHTPTGE